MALIPLPLDTTQPYMKPNHHPFVFLLIMLMTALSVSVPHGCHGNYLICYNLGEETNDWVGHNLDYRYMYIWHLSSQSHRISY